MAFRSCQLLSSEGNEEAEDQGDFCFRLEEGGGKVLWEWAFQERNFLELLSIVPSSPGNGHFSLLVLGGKKLAIRDHNSSDFLIYLLRKVGGYRV